MSPLYNIQVWWREPVDGESSSLFNKVVAQGREGDYLALFKANGDVSYINLQSTQCVNIIEVKQQ